MSGQIGPEEEKINAHFAAVRADLKALRGTACPNALHDHPLPSSYIGASDEADDRLAANWKNVECPECGQYGWKPPSRRLT